LLLLLPPVAPVPLLLGDAISIGEIELLAEVMIRRRGRLVMRASCDGKRG